MELDQLRTFIIVSDEGLVCASECLNVAQVNVSSHVKALEDELGVELFCRTLEGMEITPEGAALKGQAKRVLQEADTLLFNARSLSGEVTGVVRLGVNAASSLFEIHNFSKQIQANHPKLEFQHSRGSSRQNLRDIRSGVLEGGFVFGDNSFSADIEFVSLEQLTLVIVGSSQWQDEMLSADWSQIAAFPWVWAFHDCSCRLLVEEAFALRDLHPTATTFTDNVDAMKSLIIAGAGVGLMLEVEARSFAHNGDVCIWENEKFPITLSFAYQKNRLADPLLIALLNGVRQVWGVA